MRPNLEKILGWMNRNEGEDDREREANTALLEEVSTLLDNIDRIAVALEKISDMSYRRVGNITSCGSNGGVGVYTGTSGTETD